MAAGGWRLAAGGWRLAGGGWRVSAAAAAAASRGGLGGARRLFIERESVHNPNPGTMELMCEKGKKSISQN